MPKYKEVHKIMKMAYQKDTGASLKQEGREYHKLKTFYTSEWKKGPMSLFCN